MLDGTLTLISSFRHVPNNLWTIHWWIRVFGEQHPSVTITIIRCIMLLCSNISEWRGTSCPQICTWWPYMVTWCAHEDAKGMAQSNVLSGEFATNLMNYVASLWSYGDAYGRRDMCWIWREWHKDSTKIDERPAQCVTCPCRAPHSARHPAKNRCKEMFINSMRQNSEGKASRPDRALDLR